MRNIICSILGFIFVLACLLPPTLVDAEEEKGKIVEFTVANLDTTDAIQNTTNKFRIQLHSTWAPLGVERFEDLTESNFWDDTRIFRVVTNFISQWGINSNPTIQQNWKDAGYIQDDPVIANNDRGSVTFATSGENSRTTQIFINTKDNRFLDIY